MAAQKRKIPKPLLIVVIVVLLIAALETSAYTGLLNWHRLFDQTGMLSDEPVGGALEAYFLDVGNADCTLIKQDDHAMLIDAGERGDYDTIMAGLRRYGVERLELVIATHPHADHIGSMAKLIENVEIDHFLMSLMPEDETPTTAVYINMLKALEKKNVPVTEVLPGDQYTLGNAQVHILGPVDESDDPNAMSVVARVDYGECRFLFMGDAEEEVERTLLAHPAALKADVLKVGHHGSYTGTCKEFLQAVSPSYAVITSGVENPYGHPHQTVLTALKKAKVVTFRTDVNGTVIARYGMDGLTVYGERG